MNHIFHTREILQELLAKMKSNDDVKAKHDAVEFFMEVCQLSKNTQIIIARFGYLDSSDAQKIIEVLAETFNICQPDKEILRLEESG